MYAQLDEGFWVQIIKILLTSTFTPQDVVKILKRLGFVKAISVVYLKHFFNLFVHSNVFSVIFRTK